jgi:hypothetical protein
MTKTFPLSPKPTEQPHSSSLLDPKAFHLEGNVRGL